MVDFIRRRWGVLFLLDAYEGGLIDESARKKYSLGSKLSMWSRVGSLQMSME